MRRRRRHWLLSGLVLGAKAVWLLLRVLCWMTRFIWHLAVRPRHAVHVVRSHVREHTKGRSPRWRSVRRRWLERHPECACCGRRTSPQVHHVTPFEVDPSLELEDSNLLTLDESLGGLSCHFALAHGGSWIHFNPNVREDAAEIRRHPERRREILERARRNRIPIAEARKAA